MEYETVIYEKLCSTILLTMKRALPLNAHVVCRSNPIQAPDELV
jgi:hypothetical protein